MAPNILADNFLLKWQFTCMAKNDPIFYSSLGIVRFLE